MAFSTLPRTVGTPLLVCLTSASLISLAALPLGAQIATDRPDFVESAATVGAGAIQLETSLSYGRTGTGNARLASWSTPTLLRVGVGAVFELRIETPGWVTDASTAGPGIDNGLADAAIGFKWHVVDEAGGTPAAAILVHADLPSGAEHLQGDGIRPSLRAVAEWGLPSGFALGVMPGIALGRDAGTSFAAGILGLVVGKELTESVRSFAEVSFHQLVGAAHGGNVGSFNAGVALLVTQTVQLDTGFSWGITDAAEDFTWGLGLSVLAPGS